MAFPALFRTTTSTAAENLLVEGESSCFYHPQKKAVIPCDSCGRFLCALCDVDLNGEHICPNCLESGKTKGKLKNLEQKKTRHDRVALSLAILPMVIFYFTLITAPLTLYIAIKHWNTPVSLLPRRAKLRYSIAVALASLQIIGWIVGIYLIANR